MKLGLRLLSNLITKTSSLPDREPVIAGKKDVDVDVVYPVRKMLLFSSPATWSSVDGLMYSVMNG